MRESEINIFGAAHDAGVPILVDAEDSWFQDGIDRMANAMMAKYNKEKVIVFNTAQMYRHDRLEFLKKTLEEAKAGQSTADFIHKNAIALKEAREANYWLRFIIATEELKANIRTGTEELRDEAMVITKIVAKSIVTAKKSK